MFQYPLLWHFMIYIARIGIFRNECAAEGLACMVRMHASPVRLTLLLVALARMPSSSTYSTSASGVVTEMPIPARFTSTCSGYKTIIALT